MDVQNAFLWFETRTSGFVCILCSTNSLEIELKVCFCRLTVGFRFEYCSILTQMFAIRHVTSIMDVQISFCDPKLVSRAF